MKKQTIPLIFAFFFSQAHATLDSHQLFVPLSEALNASKNDDQNSARQSLQQIQNYFNTLEEKHSLEGRKSQMALALAIENPKLENIEQLSRALYALQKAQTPIDEEAQVKKFAKRLLPSQKKLAQSLENKDNLEIEMRYRQFNAQWNLNEKIVRETSIGHYGNIETAMNFFRIAMLKQDYPEMEKQQNIIADNLNAFIQGERLQLIDQEQKNINLKEAIQLLKQGQNKIKKGQYLEGQKDIENFLRQWPIFEHEVRQANLALYNKIEANFPIIISQLQSETPQALLNEIIQSLEEISP